MWEQRPSEYMSGSSIDFDLLMGQVGTVVNVKPVKANGVPSPRHGESLETQYELLVPRSAFTVCQYQYGNLSVFTAPSRRRAANAFLETEPKVVLAQAHQRVGRFPAVS
jgi:hypothetical protein